MDDHTATTFGQLVARAERLGVAHSSSIEEQKAWEQWLAYFDADWDTPLYYLTKETEADNEQS